MRTEVNYTRLLPKLLGSRKSLPNCVLACLTCLHVHMLSMLACFMSLRAHMSYMLAVLKYLMCLGVCLLGILVCSTFFIFEK